MVIDFFVTARPSPMEWSLIFLCLHQGPLWWNGNWFSYVYIKALSDGMIIDFLMFTSRPSPMKWSLIFLCLHQCPLQWNGHWFLCYSKTLSNGMVIFSFFTSRPSPMEWSLIFLCLYQGPLQWNGHWFLCHIKTLSDGMVINLFVTLRPSPMEWLSLVFTFHIMSLFTELVARSVWINFYSSFSSWKSGQN